MFRPSRCVVVAEPPLAERRRARQLRESHGQLAPKLGHGSAIAGVVSSSRFRREEERRPGTIEECRGGRED